MPFTVLRREASLGKENLLDFTFQILLKRALVFDPDQAHNNLYLYNSGSQRGTTLCQGIFGSIWRHFWWSQLRVDLLMVSSG